MKSLYVLLCFFVMITVNAQTIDFQTSNQFKNALVSSGTVGGITYNSAGQHVKIDTNNDGAIQYTEAAAIYEIRIENNYSLQGVTGLQYFTALKKFTAYNTGLTTVNLQPLPTLEYVKLYDTFTSVTLTGLVNLKTLDIQQTDIMALNLAGLNALENVNISHNQINTAINLSGITTLKNVDASYNAIPSINITGSVNLEKLILLNNNLSAINLTGLTNLIELNVLNNHLTTLNVDGFVNLKNLSCGNNNLTALSIETLTNLEYLYCQNNMITALNPQGLTHLIELNCASNALSSLNVQGLSTLYNLNISGNNLTTFDAHNLPVLKFLYASGNQLTNLNVLQLPNLEYLHFDGNQMESVNLTEVPKLVYLKANNNLLTTINIELCPFISSLKVEYNNLTSMYIKNGKIENIWDFSNNPSLAYICADEDQIDFIENSAVQYGMSNLVVDSYCTIDNVTHNTLNGIVTFYPLPNGGGLGTVAQNVKVYNGSDYRRTTTNGQGNYSFTFNSQPSSSVTTILENPELFSAPSESFSFSQPSGEILTRNINFWPLNSSVAGKADVEVVLLPIVGARPGEDTVFKVLLKNKGNANASGTLNFTFDDAALDVVTVSPVPDNQQLNLLSWNYTNLLPFETREINLRLNINTPTETPAVSQGYILNYSAAATLTSVTDYKPEDNTFNYSQLVVNSFDPNDKTCLQGALVPTSSVGKYLHYLIRFENTGTANASKIIVADKIDITKFDINSIEILKSSHNCKITMNGGRVEFVFDNINLPFDDANNDGYVAFKIKTVSYLVQGDVVTNKAKIYFDYNFPIITNNAVTCIGIVPAPSVTSPQTFCNAATINDLTANNPVGTLKWYTAQTGGNLLSGTTALTNGTVYYVSQTVGSYESTRVPVTATVYQIVAPIVPAQQTFCTSALLSQLNSGNAVTVKWYSSPTETTALLPTTPLVNGNTYYASQTIMFCESPGRAAVTVTIGSPQPPVVPAQQTFCPLSTISNINVGNAVNSKCYASLTATTPLQSNLVITNNTTYYISQTINGCESTRVPVLATVSATSVPVVPQFQTHCNYSPFTISDLDSGNAVNVKWYKPTIGVATILLDETYVLTSGTYYATQTINNCESAMVSIQLTLVTPPTLVLPPQQSYCGPATVTTLMTANGPFINWYDSLTATVPLSPSTPITTNIYYAEKELLSAGGYCYSPRVSVNVTVTPNEAPILPAQQAFCNSGTVSSLDAGNAIDAKWYASATGTTPLNGNTPLVNGTTYYASQTINTCESIRTAVIVTINNTDIPEITVQQTFCNAAVVSGLDNGNATNVKWYASATATTPLDGNTALVNGTTYYASQTINNCESARTAVIVTINNTDIPEITAQQTFCNAAVVSDLNTVNSTNVKWYSSETATTPLDGNTALVNSTTYYASQTINNCESARTAVTVIINTTNAPEIDSQQIFCTEANASNLNIGNAVNIEWYFSETDSTPLSETTILTNNHTYYASQTINGCESTRTAVIVSIAIAESPQGPATQTVNPGAVLADLEIQATGNISWYLTAQDAENSQNPLNENYLIEDGTHTYYVTQTIDGCESEPFAVTVTVVLGMPDLEKGRFSLYPNPTKNILNIKSEDGIIIRSLSVYNTLGQLIMTIPIISETPSINVSGLSDGTYIISISSDKGTFGARFIKKQ